jgi:cytidine deaminase
VNRKVFTGCNFENNSYRLSVCAERVAIWKAVLAGEKQIARMAIVTDVNSLRPPCGACRQIIWEFGRDDEIVLANLTVKRRQLHIANLIPHPFDATLLKPSD